MRTTTDATSNAANQRGDEKVFWDYTFRDSKEREVAAPKLNAPVADTHAHLDMLHHPHLALARSAAHGVDFIVSVIDPTEDPAFTYNNLSEWETKARELIREWHLHVPVPRVRIIIGCHPHNAAHYTKEIEQLLVKAAANPRTSAIGEIGLDYHYDKSPRAIQREVFKRQLFLANEMMFPVSLHLREAHDDGLRILTEEGMPTAGTLLHCYNLDFETLEPFLKLGCHVAFGGPLTFKKSDDLREAAKHTPLARIQTETDSPFMAPEPVRGTVCDPSHTIFIAAKLAEVFEATGHDSASLLTRFYENARNLFDRDTTFWQDNEKAIRLLLSKTTDVLAGKE
jgi:TatD DNase family protein